MGHEEVEEDQDGQGCQEEEGVVVVVKQLQ